MIGWRLRTTIMVSAFALVTACTSVPGGTPQDPATESPSALVTASAPAPGCVLPDLPPETSPDPKGAPGFGGPLKYPPLLSTGTQVPSVTDPSVARLAPMLPRRRPNGLPLQAVILNPDNDVDPADGETNPSVTILYAEGPVAQGDNFIDVVGSGGAMLIETATHGQDASAVKDVLGALATVIKVGSYDAAYVESSTFAGGFRTHSVYWSDGRLDYSLIVNGSGAEAVSSAQSIYCE